MTKKEKLETFDAVKAQADKNSLAVYDLVNDAFSGQVRINERDYDATGGNGHYTMRVSMRSMPLFLVCWCVPGQAKHTDVWTDSEIQDYYRDAQYSLAARILMQGRNELMAREREQAA